MYLLKMKTKIYNNLIFSLLSVCSLLGLFSGVGLFAQSDWNPSIQDSEQAPDGSYLYTFDTGVDLFPRPVANDGSVYKYYWGYAITDGAESAVQCSGGFLVGSTWSSLEESDLTEEDGDADFYENIISPRFSAVVLSVQPKKDLLGFYTDEQLQNNEKWTLCFYSGYQKDDEPPVYKYVTKDITDDIVSGLSDGGNGTPTILEHAQSVIKYTAMRSAAEVAADGRNLVTVEFSAFTDEGWNEDVGPRLLQPTSGKGIVPITFRITAGDVFFSEGGVTKTITGWRPNESVELNVYFEGNEPPVFSIAPIIKGRELNAVRPTVRGDEVEDVETDDSPADEQQPVLNSVTGIVIGEKPHTLHLYSTLFGEKKKIETSGTDREAVSLKVQEIFGRIFSVIFTLAGILMVLMLAWQGTRMIYSEFQGNVSVFADAKKRIIDIAFGSAVLLLSWVILSFVDPNLLRPRLFQTITQLGEVGQGAELYSNDLEIPDKDKSIKFDEGDKTLSITKCPRITDEDFDTQVKRIGGSLRGEVRYFYQILYSKPGEFGVYVYDEENVKAKLIPCDLSPPKPIRLSEEVETIVVFPVVAIMVEKSERLSGGGSELKKVPKKIWRGVPWKSKNRFAVDPKILEHARKIIKYTATRSAVETSADGRNLVTVEFSSLTDKGWNEDVGPRLLRSTSGKGNVPISFRITAGDVFFSEGGTSKTITGWRPHKSTELNIYFEGDSPPQFCIVPVIRQYILNEICPDVASES